MLWALNARKSPQLAKPLRHSLRHLSVPPAAAGPPTDRIRKNHGKHVGKGMGTWCSNVGNTDKKHGHFKAEAYEHGVDQILVPRPSIYILTCIYIYILIYIYYYIYIRVHVYIYIYIYILEYIYICEYKWTDIPAKVEAFPDQTSFCIEW